MYDPKCYELAKEFLEDEPEMQTDDHRAELAQRIQDVIEDYIAEVKEGGKP